MKIRLLLVGVVLRAREVWDRFSAWLLEPAERREHDRWQQERHAAALAQLSPNAHDTVAGLRVPMAWDPASRMHIGKTPTPVEPWHGKASGCA